MAPDRFDPRPIGVFDSGVGGLTVLSEIRRRLPDEATIYLGDNARAPYGPRPAKEVQAFTLAAVGTLLNADIKLLVIACNTATAQALPEVRSVANVPVIGVVRPGALAVSAATRSGHVGVLATAGTVASGAYPRAILEARTDLVVHQQACPDLVPLVEAGTLDGADIEAAVEGYLGALRERDGEIDTLLLGCTHYPLLRQLIERVAGARVAIVDSAHTTAMAVEDLLDELRARAPAPDVRAPAQDARASAADVRAPAPDEPATHRIMTTGNVDAFNAVAERVFGAELPAVEQVSVEDLVPTASGGGSAIEAASVTRG